MKAAWLHARRILKICWAKLPVIGGLSDAPCRALAEAAKELVFVWSLSLVPLAVSIVVDAANPPEAVSNRNFWEAISRNVKAGEIFIYVNALLAPIGFILYKHNRDDAKFPNHISFMWVVSIALPISAAIFVLQRRGIITNQHLIDQIAIGIFSVALLMRYTSMVYDIMRGDVVASKRAQEDDLVRKMEKYSENK